VHGDEEVGGVQRLPTERLDEGAQLLVVSAPEGDVLDGVARPAPALDVALQLPPPSELDRPVERGPDHQLGVGEVPPVGADLPDPLVRLVPGGARLVGHRLQELPVLGGEVVAVEDQLVRRLQQLAVDVELALRRGAVADADGPGAAVALQVVEAAPPAARSRRAART
jgi:hypothetical protein